MEISLIIAFSMSITPIISDKLHIPKKLRAWVNILIIAVLNVLNNLIFGDQNLIEALIIGIEAGAVAVGIYSTGKNTIQYVLTKDDIDKEKKY